MLAQNYLTLQSVRLKAPEEWSRTQNGLSFVLAKGGAGRHVCGQDSQPLAPGDVLVVDGPAGGKLCAPARGELVFANFSVCFENLLPLFASNEIPLLQGVTDDFKRPRLYPATSPVAVECHRLLKEIPAEFNLDHRAQLLRVAAAILTVELKDAHSRRAGFVRAEDHMIQVFERLSSAELLSLSVDELAAKFSCGRRHLNRLFHQHFGVSVATLRMEMRLLKAVSLLRNPDAKVIHVAEQSGFNHLGLFNTCFKRRFGHSPGQWRKLHVEAGRPPDPLVADGPHCPLRTNGLCPWSDQRQNPVGAKTLPGPKAPSGKVDLVASLDLPNPNSGSPRTGKFLTRP
jgi:AraC-like DNA-binding protein